MAVIDKGQTELFTSNDEEFQEPKDYVVVLLNDNFTTREFVVEVLKLIFHMSHTEASRIMLNVHHDGRATVGVYTWDVANTKADQVHTIAKQYDYPLRCIVEEA